MKNLFKEVYDRVEKIYADHKAGLITLEEAKIEVNKAYKLIEYSGAETIAVYHEYKVSRDNGNELLDISGCIFTESVAEMAKAMITNNINEFTYSSTYSDAQSVCYEFYKANYILDNRMVIVKNSEGKLIPAFKFVR